MWIFFYVFIYTLSIYFVMSRYRAWCFTSYSVDDVSQCLLQAVQCVYMIYGRETCPKTDREHLQGYVYFENTKTLTAVKRILPGSPHLEPARGTPQQNIAYCSKEDTSPFIMGEPPSQGRRTDLQIVRDAVLRNNGNVRSIMAEASSLQASRYADTLLKYRFTNQYRVRKVKVLATEQELIEKLEKYGPDDCYCYTPSLNGKWFDGYDYQPVLLVFDAHELDKTLSRNLFRSRPMRVETKGGSRELQVRKVFMHFDIPVPQE